MRLPSLALFLLALLGSRAWALDLVELKDGRVLEAKRVSIRKDKLFVELNRPGQTVGYAIPIGKVVPEFVFYAWRRGVPDDDVDGLRQLAVWARSQGLFRHALRAYREAAANDEETRGQLDSLKAEMHREQATWLFEEAWRLFREGDVKAARRRAESVLDDFADTAEVGRAKELLNIIAERELFLTEQKKQEEIARRARKHRRAMESQLARIERADREVLRARMRHADDARRRLSWAAYTYRRATLELADLLAVVEVDDLRLALKAQLDGLQGRMVRTFLKLGDLRFVTGDVPGALDAVHEVLAIDPANKQATGLRDRLLDVGRDGLASRPDVRYGYPYGIVYTRRLLGRRYSFAPRTGLGIYAPSRTIGLATYVGACPDPR